MEKLLSIALEKIKAQLGEYVVAQINEALLGGKEISLADIKKLVEGLQVAINGLPAEIMNYMNGQKYVEIISLAEHNIQEGNIQALLDFLDDSIKDSYWAMANVLAINMTGVSVTEMENNHKNPENINFARQSYMNTAKKTKLSQIVLMSDYVDTITRHAITLTAAVVTLQQTAINALKKISVLKKGEKFYDACQARLNNPTTQKYLPFPTQAAGKGLSYLLSPALNQAPRAVIGVDLAVVFEGAAGSGSPWLAVSSYRFKNREYRYLQWEGVKNPWFSNRNQKNWYFKFADNKFNEIAIINGSDKKGYLTIGLPDPNKIYPDPEKISEDYGVRVVDYKVTWNWYVFMVDARTIHVFSVAPGSMILKSYLSTKNRFVESWSFVQEGRWQSDSDSQWVLEVNGF